MKFFVFAAKDAAQAEEVYEGIRKFNAEQMGATLSPRRIYSVSGVHDGKPFTATVGQEFERLREVVVAILLDTSRDLYFICTPNRGVIRGEPYLSGSHEIRNAEDFEE
ncbi:MAG TPA: hypothetical protein VHA33_01550 [Candidatus Angelobacter sp.]|jgi:hypothetical protein|nr:hypothetical protein [Candidatus Angelobacter sp.]